MPQNIDKKVINTLIDVYKSLESHSIEGQGDGWIYMASYGLHLKKDVKTTYRKYLILLLVLSLTVTLLTPVFAEEAEPEEAAQQTETVEENAPAEETHVSDVEDDAVSRAIRDYVTSLGGTHPTPYVKGGMAMAWGCLLSILHITLLS